MLNKLLFYIIVDLIFLIAYFCSFAVPFSPSASATTVDTTSIRLQLSETVSQCTHYKISFGSQTSLIDCRLTYFNLTGLNSDSLVNVSVNAVSNYSGNGSNISQISRSPTLTSAWTRK